MYEVVRKACRQSLHAVIERTFGKRIAAGQFFGRRVFNEAVTVDLLADVPFKRLAHVRVGEARDDSFR